MELTKKTPLYQRHLDNHAHVVDYAGWYLPIEYESVLKEAKAARTTCGLFDVSHMGEIKVAGKDALKFLQKYATNDVSCVDRGQLQYNLLLNSFAGVIDDFMLYNLGDSYLCVVNASNSDTVYGWLKSNQAPNVEVTDESQQTALLTLQGPQSCAILEKVLDIRVSDIKYMHFIEERIYKEKVIISRSGYTGEDGFEVYCPSSLAVTLWDMMIEKGKDFGLCLCGLGARDILRIEAGYPLYGHEISTSINPIEASLMWAVKLNKEFIGKNEIIRIREEEGVIRKRVGFIMHERALPRQGYQLFSQESIVGEVTSATYSPNIDRFIGMALVEKSFAELEVPIELKIRENYYKGEIASYPFVRIRTKKS